MTRRISRQILGVTGVFLLWLILGIISMIPADAQTGAGSGDSAKTIAALLNVAVTIKASPGVLDSVSCLNANPSPVFLQFYDTTSAVTPGTTVAKFFVPLASGSVLSTFLGMNMFSAIKVAATTTSGGGTAAPQGVQCSIGFK